MPGDLRRIQQGVGPGAASLPSACGRAITRVLGAVGVLPRDLDVDGDPAPGAGQVGHLGDLPVRDDVQRTRGVTQVDESQRDVLDGALDGADANDVAQRELMLELEEEPGHEVAHEALRAERHREADDAGAGEQRRDVEAELAQHQQQRDDDEHRTTDVPEQLGGGPGALLRARCAGPVCPSSPHRSMRCAISRMTTQATNAPRSTPATSTATSMQPVESMQLPIAHRVRARDALQQGEGVHRGKLEEAPPDGQRNGLPAASGSDVRRQ